MLSKSEAGRLGAKKATEVKRRRYDESPKYCPLCDKKMPFEKKGNKFCSRSCAASFNNRGVRRHGRERRKCGHCGKPVKWAQNKFCDQECFNNHKEKEFIESWLAGKEDGIRAGGLQVSKTIRRWVETKHEGRCSICGLDRWMSKPMPLILDHINGNPLDNRPENLRMVCGNCDMQLPTYKAKNKGKGRKARRKTPP